jgi:outer membrane immunogenic protein
MKKLFSISALAAAAALAWTGSATAADMPVKAPPPPPPPVISWTGFYFGGHTGWGFSTANWTSDWNCAVGTLCDSVHTDIDGAIGGAQFGYRWQFTNFVLGVEAMLSAADIKGTTTGLLCAGGTCGALSATGAGLSYFTRISGQGLLTGQAGFVWNNSLLYVKGGWAAANVTRNLRDVVSPAVTFTTGDINQHVTNGWTVGVGWDYQLAKNYSFGIEYDFVRLPVGALTTGAITTPGGAFAFPTTQSGMDLDVHEIVFRGNYRFAP